MCDCSQMFIMQPTHIYRPVAQQLSSWNTRECILCFSVRWCEKGILWLSGCPVMVMVMVMVRHLYRHLNGKRNVLVVKRSQNIIDTPKVNQNFRSVLSESFLWSKMHAKLIITIPIWVKTRFFGLNYMFPVITSPMLVSPLIVIV